MIPGVGRAVWQSGASGGGTGRTPAWDTYDGTEDTAWQQWLDDTSTAISSSYDVTTSKGSSNSYGNKRCWLAIQNGNTGYIGYVMADQDDATNCQIKLVEAGEVGNINIAGRVGPVVLTTATEDNGSLIAFKEAADNITSSGKISGLYPYTDGSTDALQLAGHWRQWSYAATDPFTGSSTTYAGSDYTQGSTEFTYDGTTYLSWPANRTTTYLWLQMPMRNETPYVTIDYSAPVALYKIDNLLDLFDTPSAAVEQLETNTDPQSDSIFFGRYGSADQPPSGQVVSYGVLVANNGTYAKVEDTVVVPGARPQYTSTPMTWNTYTIKNYSHRNGGAETDAPYVPNDGVANTTLMIQGYATEEYERTNQDVDFGNIEDWEGSTNTWANYGLNVLHNHRAASGRPDQAGKFTQVIKVGNSLVCLISNLIDETDETGVPYIYGATLNPNPIRHEDTNNSPKPDKMLIEDRLDIGTTATDSMVNDTGVSSLAVTVSDTNNSDSTNAAYEPDFIKMAHLTQDYFCVVWRKSTTAYISIFEVNQQVSDQPTFTRHAEVNLGTVPEGNISVTPMGRGVALITCGNYYKFIKVPV